MGAQLYISRRTFDYVPEVPFSRGQIVELCGACNDEALVRLGYVLPLKKMPAEYWQCDACGAKFVGMAERDGHYKQVHGERVSSSVAPRRIEPGTRMAEDLQFASQAPDEHRIEDMEDKIAPLHLDKTRATRESGTGIYEVAPASTKRKRAAKGRRKKPKRRSTRKRTEEDTGDV